jgi:hypothetical protein
MTDTVIKLDVPERIPILFPLGEQLIDGATVKPLSFQGFVECVNKAVDMTVPTTFEARLKRCRMLRQVTFYIGNTVVQVGDVDLLRLPIAAARVLLAKLDAFDSPVGKIIRRGDGISTAIVFELGTPIPLGQGKSPIKELEFAASTYGDVEDVLSATNRIQQALMLISTIAKPLGTSLVQLPSWAVNQISSADGFAISNEVVPIFLESPDE